MDSRESEPANSNLAGGKAPIPVPMSGSKIEKSAFSLPIPSHFQTVRLGKTARMT